MLLCIEFDNDEEMKKIKDFVPQYFKEVQRIGCNILYLNNELASKKNIYK